MSESGVRCCATREAVEEYMDEHGDTGCPVCWLPPSAHPQHEASPPLDVTPRNAR